MLFKIAGVQKKEDADKVAAEEEFNKPKTYSDVEVSEDDEDSFQFDRENFMLDSYFFSRVPFFVIFQPFENSMAVSIFSPIT